MTTSPLASVACTRLPGSTRRTPVTPSMGERDARVVEVEPRALDGRLVDLHRALGLPDQRRLIVDLLLRDQLLARAASR